MRGCQLAISIKEKHELYTVGNRHDEVIKKTPREIPGVFMVFPGVRFDSDCHVDLIPIDSYLQRIAVLYAGNWPRDHFQQRRVLEVAQLRFRVGIVDPAFVLDTLKKDLAA